MKPFFAVSLRMEARNFIDVTSSLDASDIFDVLLDTAR